MVRQEAVHLGYRRSTACRAAQLWATIPHMGVVQMVLLLVVVQAVVVAW
jgi:hypothetical protein